MGKPELEVFKSRGEFAQKQILLYATSCPNRVVSDIGAGFGFMKEHVEELKLEWQPFDYYKKIDDSIIWDLNKPAPPGVKKAGMVLLLEVLEHLPNPLLSLKHIYDHMEIDGVLIITTPNPRSSKSKLNLLNKGELYAFQEEFLDEYHVFTPWKHVVQEFLKTTGFEVLNYVCVDDNYSRMKPNSLKEFIKFKIERFLERRDPYSVGMSYGIIARKTT